MVARSSENGCKKANKNARESMMKTKAISAVTRAMAKLSELRGENS